eukprot:COSAG03_NODE_23288_length_281_cov_0.846154_1_plen_76_part_10
MILWYHNATILDDPSSTSVVALCVPTSLVCITLLHGGGAAAGGDGGVAGVGAGAVATVAAGGDAVVGATGGVPGAV